jgi:hypothetical protein
MGLSLRFCAVFLPIRAVPRPRQNMITDGPFPVIAANTVAKPLDNTCHMWTTLEYRPGPQITMDGFGQLAYAYGSEGWAFESLRARTSERAREPQHDGHSVTRLPV